MQFTHHILILAALCVGVIAACCSCFAESTPQNGQPKLILSSPLTHSDWVLKDNVPGLDDGLAGVRHMLDMCKAAGWSKIYWRCLDSGRSLYPSNLMDPMGPPHGDSYFDPKPEEIGKVGAQKNDAILQKMKDHFHYGTIDSLAEAVRYGHEIGIEIHAWFSINEDDHAWGWPSRYTLAHPEQRWKRRDGGFYHSQLSFAYPEVRKYKLAIIKEVLDKYKVDGVFLDWIRTGDVRDPQVDAGGVADYGYEDILVKGFKTKYKIDPHDIPNNDIRWVQYRAQPQTEFMKMVRKLTNSKKTKLPVAVLVQHPWSYRGDNPKYADNLQGLLLDVETWAKDGLIDAAVPAGYYYRNSGGTPELAYNYLKKLVGDKVDVWLYGWVPTNNTSFQDNVTLAHKLGAKQILFWEADYIDNNPNKTELQKIMSDTARIPGRITKVEVTDYSDKVIYHSPDTPGYTSWVGLIQLPDGTLRCDFRQITGPTSNPVSSSPKLESKDNGDTWTVISSGSSGGTGSYGGYQLSDDSFRGTVVLPDWITVVAHWPAADLSASGYTTWSKDKGKTWSKPVDFMPVDKYRCWPTLIRPLRDGRLVMFAGCYKRGDGPDRMINYMTKMMFVSSDKGKSWGKPIVLMPTADGVCEESDFCELPNGDLLWIHRTEHYPDHMTEIHEGAYRMGPTPPDSYWYSDRLQTIARKTGDTFVMEKPTRVPFPHSGYPLVITTKEGLILHCGTDGMYYTADQGRTWNRLDIKGTAYYPKGLQLKDGKIIIVGHIGSDDVYGTVDQSVYQQTFKLKITRE